MVLKASTIVRWIEHLKKAGVTVMFSQFVFIHHMCSFVLVPATYLSPWTLLITTFVILVNHHCVFKFLHSFSSLSGIVCVQHTLSHVDSLISYYLINIGLLSSSSSSSSVDFSVSRLDAWEKILDLFSHCSTRKHPNVIFFIKRRHQHVQLSEWEIALLPGMHHTHKEFDW